MSRNFTVFHCTNTRDSFFYGMSEELGIKLHFPDDYEEVAHITAENVGDVYHNTQHIDKSWTENEGVIWHAPKVRSTSVGDIIRSGNDMWICAPVGWHKLDPNHLNPISHVRETEDA